MILANSLPFAMKKRTVYAITVLTLAVLSVSDSASSARSPLPRVLPLADEGEGGVSVYGDCEFKVNGDLSDPAPLFSRHGSYEIIVPDPTDTVQLINGEQLDMFCPGTGFAAPFTNRTQVTAQCLQQKYFLVDGLIYPFGNFSCVNWPTYTALRTGRQCNGGTDLIKAGFELEDGGFLQAYDVCHDEVAEATRYVHHVLYPSSYDYQHGVARPSFIELDFYGGRDVNTKYTQVQQNITISEILGLDASPYFNYTDDRILARGHMIAKTDQIFGAAQMATFLFINVAPQWQTFNGGNWEKVETSVRKYVADRNLTTDCYTGTWGVSTLPDVNGTERELYLDFDENHNGLIPVPKLYFRVVIDRETREGIVLIGVNNPYASLEQIQRDYILCEDIGHKLSWLSWYKEDLHEGYSYACTVEDFTAVVKDLPLEDLYTNGVLGLDDEPTTTDAPTSTTNEPAITTSTSDLPSSTSALPASTTVSSTTTTDEPSTTSAPASSTAEPSSTTGESSSTSSTPASTTGSPATSTTTAEPSTTGSTDSSTAQTSTTTSIPASTTGSTVATSEETSSTSSVPGTTTSNPASTTAAPPTTPGPVANQCHFSINGDLKNPIPLITPEGTLSWLEPAQSGIYTLDEGSAIDLHCTGALLAPYNRFTALTARCLGSQTFNAEGSVVNIGQFICQSWPTYEAERSGIACEGGTELLHIGFNVAAGFLSHLEICYNEEKQISRYVRYELTPANVGYQRGVAEPGYLRGDFYSGEDVNVLYGQTHQLEVLTETLGADASQYLDTSKDMYLTRGQLAARQDFVHGSEQRATHFYVNAVPQWRSITIGNWLAVERSLRQFVADKALNVNVYAGAWGVSTLPNAAGEQVELYLNHNTDQLPVPRITYRLVIDQVSRQGVVLVVANNPHVTLSETLENYVICEDIGAQLDWLDWDKTNLNEGYGYACSVEDFTAVVKDLPLSDLTTSGVLGLSDQSLDSEVCGFLVNGDIIDPAPLFVVRSETGIAKYLEPNADGLVELKHGEAMELHCLGAFIQPFATYRQVTVSCWQKQTFLAFGSLYNFQKFVCSSWPSYSARRTGRQCNGGTDLLEVGFELATNDFLQTYDVCHDEMAEVTRYAHHVLYPGSAQYQRSVARPTFITGDFYGGKDVNTMYTQVQQNITVSAILGLDASPYFNTSSNIYLARGHLAAKTDFVFGAPQKATFYFVNAAPQWQTFNGGNWERIEDSVRSFVSDQNIIADCYTGTWGVTTLPDSLGIQRELYLNFDEQNNGLIPVPKLYFRVIIDRESRNGIVLIGVNNPHKTLEEIQKDYIICKDIGEQLTWVSWTKENLLRGYSYACTVDDFIAVVKDLPLEDLTVNGVLGI
ncbi:uncharacterized protein [Drosophila tropicalis]|uniref:uncharacterized protein n=1 Tax=Drosophila tropicalis TaxID=46794 RepID=UPI0035AB7D68